MDHRHQIQLHEGRIDAAWVKGVRKWWKRWSSKSKSFDGRVSKASRLDSAILIDAGNAALRHIEHGRSMIRRLKDDLLYNKGMWMPDDREGRKSKFDRIATKVVDELSIALDEAFSAVAGIKYVRRGGYHGNAITTDIDVLNRAIVAINNYAEGYTAVIDKAISGKLLRHLSKVINSFDDEGDSVLDMGTFEPASVSIGKARLIFLDSEQKLSKKNQRNPRFRKKYIMIAKAAQRALTSKGLGRLWYGDIYVKHGSDAPSNHLGIHFGVGATFHPSKDVVTLYSNPSPSVPSLIVHELGHRYYYKFMSQSDRANFDKWFGKTAPTSEYGATISSEDFAEVFSDYVSRSGHVTRDQASRLKQFFGRKMRSENIEDLRHFLEESRTFL